MVERDACDEFMAYMKASTLLFCGAILVLVFACLRGSVAGIALAGIVILLLNWHGQREARRHLQAHDKKHID